MRSFLLFDPSFIIPFLMTLGILGGYIAFAIIEDLYAGSVMPLVKRRWRGQAYPLLVVSLIALSATIIRVLLFGITIVGRDSYFLFADAGNSQVMASFAAGSANVNDNVKTALLCFFHPWPVTAGFGIGFLLAFRRLPLLLKPFAIYYGLVAFVRLFLFATVTVAPMWLAVALDYSNIVLFFGIPAALLAPYILLLLSAVGIYARKGLRKAAISEQRSFHLFPHCTVLALSVIFGILAVFPVSSDRCNAAMRFEKRTAPTAPLVYEPGELWFCAFKEDKSLAEPVKLLDDVTVVRGYKRDALAVRSDGTLWEASSVNLVGKPLAEWFVRSGEVVDITDVCINETMSIALLKNGKIAVRIEQKNDLTQPQINPLPEGEETAVTDVQRHWKPWENGRYPQSSVIRIASYEKTALLQCKNGTVWQMSGGIFDENGVPVFIRPMDIPITVAEIGAGAFIDTNGICWQHLLYQHYDDWKYNSEWWNSQADLSPALKVFVVESGLNASYSSPKSLVVMRSGVVLQNRGYLMRQDGSRLSNVLAVVSSCEEGKYWLLEKQGRELLYSEPSDIPWNKQLVLESLQMDLPPGKEITDIAAFDDGLLLKVR